MGAAAIIVAAATASLMASGGSAYAQIQTANESADMQAKQIREQQIQLRLQENQASIDRMKKLQQTLAAEEVMFGSRNISGASGTVRAISMHDMSNFYEDENADRLNYAAKQISLNRQREMVYAQRRAQVFNAVTGFVKEGASTILAAHGVPSSSAVEKSEMPKSTAKYAPPSVQQSMATRSFLEKQRSQFDLNA